MKRPPSRFTQLELRALMDVALAAQAAGTEHEAWEMVYHENGEDAAHDWASALESGIQKLAARRMKWDNV